MPFGAALRLLRLVGVKDDATPENVEAMIKKYI